MGADTSKKILGTLSKKKPKSKIKKYPSVNRFIKLLLNHNTKISQCVVNLSKEYDVDKKSIISILEEVIINNHYTLNFEGLLKGINKMCPNKETEHGVNVDLYDPADLHLLKNHNCSPHYISSRFDIRPISKKIEDEVERKNCPMLKDKSGEYMFCDDFGQCYDTYLTSLSHGVTNIKKKNKKTGDETTIYRYENDDTEIFTGKRNRLKINEYFAELKNFMSSPNQIISDKAIKYFQALKNRPDKPIKVYRGFHYKSPEMNTIKDLNKIQVGEIVNIPHSRSHSWTTNLCVAMDFASSSDKFGMVFSTILDPKDIIVDTRRIDSAQRKELYRHDQHEIIVKPGTYKSVLEYIITFSDFYGKKPIKNKMYYKKL